ncbi:MAG: DUF2617 family protein [Chloroflexi bacterium]|nr:DUF2617 family protein [Chloroflexota bacterium]
MSKGPSHATATLGYVEQPSTDLVYYLFESQAPREAVRVLAERSLSLPRATLTLAIIGSSHFLEIRAGDLSLCEMLACPRPGLGPASLSLQVGNRERWSHSDRRANLGYSCEIWRQKRTAEEFATLSADLPSPAPNQLHFSFPARSGPGAITHLEWVMEGSTVTVGTLHTFPGELTVVRSRSVIELAAKGASS